MGTETNETNLHKLEVVLQSFEAKIEQIKRIDENILTKIEEEEELETEIVETDDYLDELMDKWYRIQLFISQHSTLSNASKAPQAHVQGEH